MDVPVMLEQVNGNGYRAVALLPSELIAEAPTRKEAVEKIQILITERLSTAELIQVRVPTSTESQPWMDLAGIWKNHPDIDEVVENMAAYRREVDADSERL